MRLPEIAQSNDRVSMLNTFMGLNKNPKITENEFADMKNITNDYFPTIGTRKKRGIARVLTKAMGTLGGAKLTFVDNNKFYFDESYVCDLESTDAERQLVSMGAYIVVFPDGLIYNTETRETDSIENEVTTSAAPTLTLCRIDGSPYDAVSGTTPPGDTSKYWIDTSANPVVLKMYSSNTSSWVSVGTTYVKFSATDIGVGFSDYDAATFTGVDTGSYLYNNWDFNQSNIIYKADDNYLVVAGLINVSHTNSSVITVSRKMPEMDYVCELNNRIYGCSSEKHEVYASKLGDPKNWYCYAGLDSDSYAATVGTQEEFTGAISYRGYVFFFKEGGYHQLYGTKPSNFQISWNPGRGVQIGSSKSLCVVNNYLMFKSREGICLFDGSTQIVSENLGSESYYDAVGGAYRDKYYISMRDNDYKFRVYVYDTSKGTWCIEDSKRFIYSATTSGALYLIDINNVAYMVNNENMYKTRFPSQTDYPSLDTYPGKARNGNLEETLEWMLETGDIGVDSPWQKYLKRLDLRLSLKENAKLRIEVEYDSTDDWYTLYDYFCTKKRSYSVPIHVQRCDHLRLRFSGFGEFRLFSIAKIIEEGSDV